MNLYKRINNVLLEYSNDEDTAILDASELDGYFFAIGCAPKMIPPSQWLPMIWGGEQYAPKWPDMKTAQRFITDVMQHYNDVMQQLNNNECNPLFNVHTVNGKNCYIADEWCNGFQRGLKLMGEAANKIDEDFDLLTPILLFSDEKYDKRRDQLGEDEINFFHDKIPGCVLRIHRLLVANTPAPVRTGKAVVEPFAHTAPKPGRNDLCSCGSGKKYKKCCGAN